MGQTEEAIDDLTDYLGQRPNDPNALHGRALHHRAQGRLAAAVADLEVIKRTNPLALELEPRLLLARLRQQVGRNDLWLRELESLVEDAPDSAQALQELVRAYIHEKRLTDAERIVTARINRWEMGTAPEMLDAGARLESRTSLAPESPVSISQWHLLRGRISLELGDKPKAVEQFRRMVAVCTDDRERAELLTELGGVYQAAGDPAGARQAYEEALGYDGDNWITLNNLAYLLSDQFGEDELALPYAERAVAAADNVHTLDTLGWIYVGLGEYSLAVTQLRRVVRLDPGAALSYYHLGEAYRRSGQLDEAADILKRGRDLARADNDTELVALFDASLDRMANAE